MEHNRKLSREELMEGIARLEAAEVLTDKLNSAEEEITELRHINEAYDNQLLDTTEALGKAEALAQRRGEAIERALVLMQPPTTGHAEKDFVAYGVQLDEAIDILRNADEEVKP